MIHLDFCSMISMRNYLYVSGSLLLYNIFPKYVHCMHVPKIYTYVCTDLLSLRFSLNASQIILAPPTTSYDSGFARKT